MKKLTISILIFTVCLNFGNCATLYNDENKNQAQPYLWPNFPFFPGVNFPPSLPEWMTQRRPEILPQLPEIRFPPINIPWPFPPNDDDDDEEDIEECPEDGIKFISHPEKCEKYILCIDGDEVATLECPGDFHFSRDLRACTNADDAECE